MFCTAGNESWMSVYSHITMYGTSLYCAITLIESRIPTPQITNQILLGNRSRLIERLNNGDSRNQEHSQELLQVTVVAANRRDETRRHESRREAFEMPRNSRKVNVYSSTHPLLTRLQNKKYCTVLYSDVHNCG